MSKGFSETDFGGGLNIKGDVILDKMKNTKSKQVEGRQQTLAKFKATSRSNVEYFQVVI